jgi:acetyl esterase/lipase
LLASCSPFAAVNAVVPSATYRRTVGLPFDPHARNLLDVYQPASASGASPVVIFFYGGNWATGNRTDYVFAGEALASMGYVAVLPDYRLYPEVRFPGFLEDCAEAVRWTVDHIAQLGGDPERVFLMGHSAGAYNAAMLALDAAYLRGVGIEAGRVRGLIGLAGPYDFLPLQSRVTKSVFGFPDTPITTQPIHFVTAQAPPALLITGSGDKVVDPGNSARLAARLLQSGVPAREIVYPRLGHAALVGALARPLRWLAPVLDDVAQFVSERSVKPS